MEGVGDDPVGSVLLAGLVFSGASCWLFKRAVVHERCFDGVDMQIAGNCYNGEAIFDPEKRQPNSPAFARWVFRLQ